jgi:hypothetical protein
MGEVRARGFRPGLLSPVTESPRLSRRVFCLPSLVLPSEKRQHAPSQVRVDDYPSCYAHHGVITPTLSRVRDAGSRSRTGHPHGLAFERLDLPIALRACTVPPSILLSYGRSAAGGHGSFFERLYLPVRLRTCLISTPAFPLCPRGAEVAQRVSSTHARRGSPGAHDPLASWMLVHGTPSHRTVSHGRTETMSA